MMLFSDNPRNPEYAKDPAVVRFGGRYLMYYSIPPWPKDDARQDQGWGIAIAESSDLENWHFLKELSPLSSLEQHGFCAPAARVFDGRVHLFYQTYGSLKTDAICHAESSDGVHFVPDSANPVYHPEVSKWSCGRAIDADVIEFHGKRFLYCATRDPEMQIQKLAVAETDARDPEWFHHWKTSFDGSILEPELVWEKTCIEAPATLVHNDKVYLFYGGAYNNAPQQIGCAVSSDGIHFLRIAEQPVLPCGNPGEWNSSESGHPYAFTDDDGAQYLFFQGNDTCGKTWHLSVRKIHWRNDVSGKDGLPFEL